MNTLYIWFPASWAPSVVEAIEKRNRKWLSTSPVLRDPSIFTDAERDEALASRDMSYKIQRWNVKSEKTLPILLANARVDWLGLEDEIIKNFSVLREGILNLARCVFPTCIVCVARCTAAETDGVTAATW